jgi:cupin 2 domain-containing protein
MPNLFENLPQELQSESSETLLESPLLRIERIVSHGHASPDGFWYDQEDHEWALVLRGRAQLRFADTDALIELTPGDYIEIAAHRRHRVERTTPEEPTVWLAIHYS